jgi:actin-related protein 5
MGRRRRRSARATTVRATPVPIDWSKALTLIACLPAPPDDGFGQKDDDWAVYREIDGADMEEDEEDDVAYLSSVEAKLLEHDPTFTAADTYESQSGRQNALLTAFLRGGSAEPYRADDLAQSFQLHLNVERSRVPETWFQPHLAGLDSAGLGEVIGHVLRELPEPTQARVQRGILATGGSTALPGLRVRLENTLRPILPYKSEFRILLSPTGDERVDAWKGMAAYSQTDEFRQIGVTRAEYDEYGGEWIKEGAWGNWRTG